MPVKRTRLSKRVAKLLGAERVCRVATVGEAGTPHVVPVCHVVIGDRVYFGSGDDARKVRNMSANPRVAVTVDLYAEDWSHIKGVMVQGRGSSRAGRRSAGSARSCTGSTPSTRASPHSTRRTPWSSRRSRRGSSSGGSSAHGAIDKG